MPRRPVGSLPSYRKHKASGRAVVSLPIGNGRFRDVYLGVYGTAESKREYARVVAEWEANGRRLTIDKAADLTVNELLLAFMQHADQHYRRADGTRTQEFHNYRVTLKPVKELFGKTPAAEFGPVRLRAVRDRMIAAGLCRRTVNQRVGKVRHVWKWGASQELVSVAAWQALTTVEGLQAGRTVAPDHPEVEPVDVATYTATLPFLPRHVRGILEFMRWTGCRPGEACSLRWADVDRSGETWLYTPRQHKAKHHGKRRVIAIGPKAQGVLMPFLFADPEAPVFSPFRQREERFSELRRNRKTKVPPSQRNRRKRKPRRLPGHMFTPSTIAHAVARAVAKAGVSPWHPHQLRHLRATELRKQFGLDVAQVLLGHAQVSTTQIYAARDVQTALKVAAEVG